mgnify:CR=1 FL=1
MDVLQEFSRSKSLNNVPKRKLYEKIELLNKEQDHKIKVLKVNAANRYYESNIPIDYWSLKMEKDFQGDPRLLKFYNDYTTNIKKNYTSGSSFCLAGNYGLGKTMAACCVLKKCVEMNFSCLYTTLSDIVATLSSSDSEDKFTARRELCMVDFLVIDEFDSRFISTDNAADLYARTLESIFRTRAQNKLPTLMCTNSPNILETFNGALKKSIESLMTGYMKIFPVFGDDFRKKLKP